MARPPVLPSTSWVAVIVATQNTAKQNTQIRLQKTQIQTDITDGDMKGQYASPTLGLTLTVATRVVEQGMPFYFPLL